jgi:hypothetical protein
MIAYDDIVEAGEEVICTGARGVRILTNGKRYTAINGLEEGIFPDRPYITVITDNGMEGSYHAARFRKLTPEDNQ